MQAIEFETYLKDGIIKIPEKYSNFNEKKIKVIIMSEDISEKEIEKNQRINKYMHFQNYVNKHTKDLKFDDNIDIDRLADEINEVNL